ncbi:probable F-box protein At4g22030 [Eucalyptus grandis]|uniref:probable F-box protein At4g22030 n=1 Tax=Eucalyptus grandis TaxID=71139 RepID=UPI00192EB79B|nr:probable F-box protein At4g22030 [Eucalyptus grandis]
MTEKVLALDRACPLSLLEAMLEKFPVKLEPAAVQPRFPTTAANPKGGKLLQTQSENGWSEDLEVEMRAIVQVLKSKEKQDYLRLGSLALKLNKMLAVSAPLLTGIATAGSAFGGSTVMVAAITGAMAAIINRFNHLNYPQLVFKLTNLETMYYGRLRKFPPTFTLHITNTTI